MLVVMSHSIDLDRRLEELRDWRGTVLAAVTLARSEEATTKRQRQAAVRAAVTRVSEELGNTPTVARASYIDPNVIDAFEHGRTIPADAPTPEETGSFRTLSPAERAVLDLLG